MGRSEERNPQQEKDTCTKAERKVGKGEDGAHTIPLSSLPNVKSWLWLRESEMPSMRKETEGGGIAKNRGGYRKEKEKIRMEWRFWVTGWPAVSEVAGRGRRRKYKVKRGNAFGVETIVEPRYQQKEVFIRKKGKEGGRGEGGGSIP